MGEGGEFEKEVFAGARHLIATPDAKWMKFATDIMDELDPHVVKTHVLNLGYHIDLFIEAVERGMPSPISAQMVLPAMKAVFACAESAERGGEVVCC